MALDMQQSICASSPRLDRTGQWQQPLWPTCLLVLSATFMSVSMVMEPVPSFMAMSSSAIFMSVTDLQ